MLKTKKRTTEEPAKKKWKGISKKLVVMGIVLVIFCFVIYFFRGPIIDIIKRVPWLYSIYNEVSFHIANKTLKGLFYVSFFGSLFFIMLPIEVFLFYFMSSGHSKILVLATVIAGNIAGLVVDYLIGFLIGGRLLRRFFEEHHETFKRKLEKVGSFIVVLGNIIPFPIELASVFLGTMRFGIARFVLLTLAGRVVRYSILLVGYSYLMRYVMPFFTDQLMPWLIHLFTSA